MKLAWLVIGGVLLGRSAAGGPSEAGLENGRFTATVSDVTLEYEVHGSGPVLMTVPNSWGLTLEGLRGMYRTLEDRLTMVDSPPRGTGGSGPVREDSDRGPDAVRKDFESLRKHLGLEKVNAIGWSNGATNLIALAAERPESIEAAIFLHGNASFLPGDEKPIIERYPDLIKAFGEFGKEMGESGYSVEKQNARVKEFDTNVWFPYMFADREAAKRKLPEVFRDASFSWAHAQYTNQTWSTLDFRDRLPKIRARSLVIAGRHDMLPPPMVKQLADGISGAEFVVFEESGHFAPVEETDKFVKTVFEFLKVSN